MKTLSAKAKISGFTLIELSLLFFAAVSVRADTNIIAVLTTADDISYTNAHIDHVTPVYAEVWYDGGIARVVLTNLPPALQKQYPYDTNAAAQFLAAEKQKQEQLEAAQIAASAARQAWLEEQAKNAGVIYITDCTEQNPLIYAASIKGVQHRIYLKNPPPGLNNLRFAKRLNVLQYRDAYVDYGIANDYHDSDARAVARQEINQAQEEYLSEERGQAVRAFDTGLTSGGIPIWQCVAPIAAKTKSLTNLTK